MSDLISRRELIKHFETIQQEEHVIGLEFVAMIDEIKGQPTAYSVDKVVEELEKRKQEYLDGFGVHQDNELYGVACGLGDAIEIVKQGGVSDDTDAMCEWKKYPFTWFTGCDGCEINHKQGDYCPRCGKKIKEKQNDN